MTAAPPTAQQPMQQPQMQGQPSPMQNPNMQAFMQMLAQQGYPPAANLQGPPQQPAMQGGGMPPQLPNPSQMQQRPPQGPVPNMAPQQPGMQPQGSPQQLPPQIMQKLQQLQQMQRMQQGTPGQGQAAPGQQQGQQPQSANQKRFTPQELAALGRMGDNTVAHLTAGEIAVPPQVQTPKVLATLKHAFESKGAPPQNFVAGSPTSSINPATGVPEYNFWASAAPIMGGVVGGVFGGPLGAMAGSTIGGLATGQKLGSALEGGALSAVGDYGIGSMIGSETGSIFGTGQGLSNIIGDASLQPTTGQVGSLLGTQGNTVASAAGSTAGSTAADASSQTTADAANTAAMQSAMQGASSGAGAGDLSYVGGNSLASPSLSSAGSSTGNSGSSGLPSFIQQLPNGNYINTMNGQIIQASSINPQPSMLDKLTTGGTTYGNTLGAAGGAYLGQQMFNPAVNGSTTGAQPAGFNTPYQNASQLPSWQKQIGQTDYNGPVPTFTGYNPATNNPAAYNFFPTGQQNQTG